MGPASDPWPRCGTEQGALDPLVGVARTLWIKIIILSPQEARFSSPTLKTPRLLEKGQGQLGWDLLCPEVLPALITNLPTRRPVLGILLLPKICVNGHHFQEPFQDTLAKVAGLLPWPSPTSLTRT